MLLPPNNQCVRFMSTSKSEVLATGGEDGIVIRTVTSLEDISSIYDQLLMTSFGPDELISPDEMYSRVEGRYGEVVALYVQGQAVGVAVGRFFDGVTLLSYLAVSQESRGLGFGSTVLNAAVERWVSQHGGIIVAEVEDPAYYPDHPQYGNPSRRVAFYRKHGAQILDIPYFQPSLGEDSPRVHNMFLMTLHVDESLMNNERTRITSGAAIPAMVSMYFKNTEGNANPSDKDALNLFAALKNPLGIPLDAEIIHPL